MVQKFIATRSKRKALSLSGMPHPIAVKVNGGFVVYNAY
jgi:hypothetical protein